MVNDKIDFEIESWHIEVTGRIACNLGIIIALEKAMDIFGANNLKEFIHYYARDELGGLLASCCDNSCSDSETLVLMPERRTFLEVGISERLSYMWEYHINPGDCERKAIGLLSNPFLAKSFEDIEKDSGDWEYGGDRDTYASLIADELYRIYGEAWKSGPHRIHQHYEKQDVTFEDGTVMKDQYVVPENEKDKFYFPKEFMKPEADDHVAMAFVVRALSCGFPGKALWQEEETRVYKVLNAIVEWNHFNPEGITPKPCEKEGCDI